MFSISRFTKKFHSWKCPTTVRRVISLEMQFLLTFTAFGYSNNKGNELKKGNNSKMGTGIYLKIVGYVDLDMHIFAI
jgi:hypothetical protein